jgi:hypothetical protein
MTQFDLIGALRTYATSKSWAFLSGENFFKNYEASKINYSPGQLILGVDPFIARPNFTKGGKVDQVSYSGLIMLGRKFESDLAPLNPQVTTISNLDETFIQKYDRRIFELIGTLATNLGTFACANELDLTNCQFELGLNRLDENIDFVIASITFIQ